MTVSTQIGGEHQTVNKGNAYSHSTHEEHNWSINDTFSGVQNAKEIKKFKKKILDYIGKQILIILGKPPEEVREEIVNNISDLINRIDSWYSLGRLSIIEIDNNNSLRYTFIC